MRSKYITFYLRKAYPPAEARKTCIWYVKNSQKDIIIGMIKWAGNFRKYAFFPENLTQFDPNCLRDIADFCEQKTKEHNDR